MQQQAGHVTQPAVPINAHHLQQQQQQQQFLHEQPAMSSHTPYTINQSSFTSTPAISNPFVRQQQPTNQIALYQQPHPQNFMQQQQPHSFQQQPFSNFPQDNTMGQSFMQQNQFPGQQGMQQQPGFQGQQQPGFQGQQQPGFQGQQQMTGFQGQQQQTGYQGQQMQGQQFGQYQQQPMQNQMGGDQMTNSEAKQQHSELKQEITKFSSKMDDLMGKVQKH